ncbi:hypothetical protein [Xenorhabdus sp. KJ12.1]|uniref:hypothetical protein n=1 Tax=Xenorhabdus sp. KJ12.1 TaxID=1851571 RepID=UPI000C051216|nr:hypothetical protein [Xenorhabdus sp. KJ12.1]PHM72221.1 hypothetical protein Xekj_00499 [Xenorhabdus sp. KJ12.1]
MIKENISFLKCAGSIETRDSRFYNSPFNFSEEDKIILNDREQRTELFNIIEGITLPMFIIEHDTYKSSNPVLNFARMDSYLLKIAVIIYSVRLKINEEGDSERFLWTGSEETFSFLSNTDYDGIVDCLIKGEISIRPVCELHDILKGRWEIKHNYSHLLSHYLQLRYKYWRVA